MDFPERIFVIGDIHGCLKKLRLLFGRIDPQPGRDQLIFLGDYIDRGDDSRGVLDYLLQLREEYSNTIFLMGNHEKMFMDFLAGEHRDLFIYNGGDSTIRSYLPRAANPRNKMIQISDQELIDRLIPEYHRTFLNELHPFYQTENYIMVHAGLKQGIPIEEQDLDDLVWIREEFIFSEEDFGKRVIFGHTPFARPLVLPNKIGIDTGAVYGNTLTCVVLPDLSFVSV
ncbi:MAG: serine/threonine protein phosphatase [Deltaproteobacteria bacterium]|nr:MAG: serine/threonine protein phosphatase [Deltaproteobacteria bacterium]